MQGFVSRSARRLGVAAAIVVLTAAAGASGALAHSQTVSPPGQDDPTVTGPISKPYAQAHCNSNAPAIVAEASDGVVVFSPPAPLPCPAIENPGGQVHP